MGEQEPDFLAHRGGDTVAVAVRDVEPGPAGGVYLDSGEELHLDVNDRVPLGHKVALRDVTEGEDVIEYGLRIGIASTGIHAGDHAHIHNLRSARWQNSVA